MFITGNPNGRFNLGSYERTATKTVNGYGKFIGMILHCFGFALKVKDETGKTYYLNRKSAIKHLQSAKLRLDIKSTDETLIGLFKDLYPQVPVQDSGVVKAVKKAQFEAACKTFEETLNLELRDMQTIDQVSVYRQELDKKWQDIPEPKEALDNADKVDLGKKMFAKNQACKAYMFELKQKGIMPSSEGSSAALEQPSKDTESPELVSASEWGTAAIKWLHELVFFPSKEEMEKLSNVELNALKSKATSYNTDAHQKREDFESEMGKLRASANLECGLKLTEYEKKILAEFDALFKLKTQELQKGRENVKAIEAGRKNG